MKMRSNLWPVTSDPNPLAGGVRHGSRVTPHAHRGVALVITLILLSVITFLAITFLAVARREKGSVTTTTEQKVATIAAESGLEHAKALINAAILSTTNAFNFDLLVSTNFENLGGFDPNAQPQSSPNVTNVNYDYTVAGAVLNANQAQQNLANLLFSPRPPVFLTNRFYGSNEFRFYVDLNRDGRFTRTGLLIVTNQNGWFYTTDGGAVAPVMPPPFNTLSNWFTGDPQYIGILERPEFPHSPSNKFVARYAFIIVPAGKTLDVNYIHNHAKFVVAPLRDGFFRNMGVGGWENNFAAFLRDLNTNAWQTYAYNTNLNFFSTGVAFDDARSFVLYRSRGDRNQWLPRASVSGLFGADGVTAFQRDYVDGYTAGPLLVDYRGWNHQLPLSPLDPDNTRVNRHWPGADNPDHFFTTQDFFNPNKAGAYPQGGFTFVDRLMQVQTNSLSSYDRSTFYRMVAQLGTDSAPDPDDKLNVNYINVGGFKSTNFISWRDARVQSVFGRPGSEVFFTNAVDRLLKRYSAEWLARNQQEYVATFGTNRTFGAGEIPVLVNGRFAYTPAIHRILQLAANIWDTTNPTNDGVGPLPTVFRPVFKTDGRDVYIQDFVESPLFEPAELSPQPIDLTFSNAVASVQPDSLIFGVPFVIGARKGLPNFNEFASESVVQITRKLELRKSGPGGGNMIVATNQMFVIGISNAFGAEFWNSYTTAYTNRQLDIAVVNFAMLELTNDYGFVQRTLVNGNPARASGQVFTNQWPRWTGKQTDASFIVPLRTNQVIVRDSIYSQNSQTFKALTDTFEPTPASPVPLPFPRWGLAITNRVVAYIRDANTRRLLDYVQLSSMAGHRDLSGEMAQPATALDFDGLWATNSPNGIHLSDRPGVINQIQISKGDDNQRGRGDWQSVGVNQPGGATKYYEIAKFRAFFTPNNAATYRDEQTGVTYAATNTALVAVAPFSPTWKQSVSLVWQANDPLVHYTAGDMEYLERSGVAQQWNPPSRTNAPTLVNLGRVNDRYRPWGGNPFATGGGSSIEADDNAYNTVVKDAGVRSSSDWQFPTNKLATLGWLGRMHRGSPWQTVYLKATPVSDAVTGGLMKAEGWRRWSGNRLVFDAENTQPETDRVIFDVFTTGLNDNATRGQLPINQTNLAAWSAVFSGMVALTNSSTDDELDNDIRRFDPWIIDPAGIYDARDVSTNPVARIVAGINRERTRTVRVNGRDVFIHRNGTFNRLGDILSVPELTLDALAPLRNPAARTNSSPFLNLVWDDLGRSKQLETGLNDAVLEWLPQQMMSLVKLGEPRFVVYSYGQGLKPADRAVITSGPYFGMVTNYQITAEVVTRAVVRLEGAPDNPRAVVESFNVVPPE